MASASDCVRQYLDALEPSPRSTGTARSQLQDRLDQVEAKIAATSDVLERVRLYQQAIDLRKRIRSASDATNEHLEVEFIRCAAAWASSNGVSYEALRTAGVPVRVLRAAGIES